MSEYSPTVAERFRQLKQVYNYFIFTIMSKGTVKVLLKGFGFIVPEESGPDIFFHYSGCKGMKFEDLQQGDMVEYEPTEGQKGPIAVNLTRV